MNDPFRHLHIPPEMACRFFAEFSRMEYALKATPRYVKEVGTRVEADWGGFARDVDAQFLASTDKRVAAACLYLLAHPPRKQALKGGALAFVDTPVDPALGQVERLLLMVRRVRNNLFHGGKHYPDGEEEAGRNALLVDHSLTVLRHCITLNEDVRQRFEH